MSEAATHPTAPHPAHTQADAAASASVPAAAASHVLDALSFPLWGSRLIEASAGTGKTWTIAALYLRLVLGSVGDEPTRLPLQPAQILVMTFTRAATRELSDRIRARLLEAVQCFRGLAEPAAHDTLLRDLREQYPEGPARTKAAWLLEMAAQGMDDAAIHTIDAWCQRMLREHAFDSGNLFDETLEPDESQRRTESAQDYWRQQCYPLQRAQLAWVTPIWKDYEAFRTSVMPLLEQDWAPTPSDAQPLSALLGAVQGTTEALAAHWQAPAKVYCDWLLQQVKDNAAHWSGNKASLKQVTKWTDAFLAWTRDPAGQQNFWADTSHTAPSQRLRPEGLLACRNKSAPELTLPPEAQAFDELAAQMAALPALAPLLRRHAAVHMQQRLQWLKQQSGTFGFADMLQRLNRALEGAQGETLRASIILQYPAALIDEFQDTSPPQYRLFDHIYRTAANDPHSTLLLIGDPKQSIYGFRGADIYSYLHARRATEGRHYVLGTNYRSTHALVDAVNHWFVQAEQRTDAGRGAFLFREVGGSTPLPFVPVAAQGRREVLQSGGAPLPALTLAWACETGADGKAQAWDGRTILKHFSQQCANQIVHWLMDDSTGFAQPGGGWQRLKPADIAVLVRTGKEAQAVRRALAARGVASVYLSDRESVFASAEADDLVHWLRAVAAPRDARLVRAALATPLVSLSFAELAALASDEEAFDARSELLQQLHSIWQRQGVLAMLRQTLYRLNLPAQWLAAMDGERRLTNFLHLAELLQTASAQLEGELALIRWLVGQQQASGLGDAQIVRLESDADLVKVVTIHKSKGLEYPVVCLPFAGSFRAVDGKAKYLSLPVEDADSPQREVLLEFDKPQIEAADRERLREDLRLLYVALTRPRHALWMGWAPMRVGRSDKCVNEHSAAGYLLSGGRMQTAEGWDARVQQLAQDCPAICMRDVLGQALPDRQYHAQHEAPALQLPEAYSATFDTRWGIGSFSSLTRAMAAHSVGVAGSHTRQPAQDEVADDALQQGSAEAALQALPVSAPAQAAVWHRFMRGPVVGNFIHDQLEWLAGEDFALQPVQAGNEDLEALPPHSVDARLLRRCERAGRTAQAADALQWLRAVVHHPLPPLDVNLQQLAQANALLPEMEFWLPAARLSAPAIDALCRQYVLPGQPRPALPQRELHGMLMGFADLVLVHEGRYWVMDYKTNHLGVDSAAYGPQALAQAMLTHRYDVQAALYLLALHRLLQSRLGASYDPAEQLGGALYFFLRGLDGPAHGMHVLAPDMALLDALDDLLATEPAATEESRP